MNSTGNNGIAWHSTVGGTRRSETLGYKWNCSTSSVISTGVCAPWALLDMRSCWKGEDTSTRGQRRIPGTRHPSRVVLVLVGWLASDPEKCRPQFSGWKCLPGGLLGQGDPTRLPQGGRMAAASWEQRGV